MVERGDQAVVVGRGPVADDHRAAAAAFILVALGRILLVSRKREFWFPVVEQLVPAAPALTAAGPVVTMPVQPVPPAPQTPGMKTAGSKVIAHRIVARGVADVVDLRLPAVAELTLNAERPLDGVGRLEVRHRHDVLRLGEEQRLRRRGNGGLRERAGGECARRPGSGEGYRPRR